MYVYTNINSIVKILLYAKYSFRSQFGRRLVHLGARFVGNIFIERMNFKKLHALRSTKLKTRSTMSRIIKGGKKTLRNDAATSVIERSRTMITVSETKLSAFVSSTRRSTNVNYLRIVSCLFKKTHDTYNSRFIESVISRKKIDHSKFYRIILFRKKKIISSFIRNI